MSEDELFEFLATKLHEMIDKIEIRKTVNSQGDFYEKHIVPVTENATLEEYGIKVIRKDYYSRSKHIFCLQLM